jgi:tetratricopeptide (TPR) repeat protein
VEQPPVAGAEVDQRVGTYIGRYALLAALGRGARGVLWKARDTRLERNVALKLLPPEAFARGEDSAERARLNLVREAQAMARITHENVLRVFDAGTHAEEVYVAMELVEGQSLTDWLAQPRDWREIVSAFVQAGSGLGAAHAQGIFHRDFKAENVIVGQDGRVRVADFGLGEVAAQAPAPAHEPTEPAAADQFDFCVALYRALYGQAPFDGETTERPREPPRGSRVSVRVQKAITRGLARRPQDRHPSMAGLLDVLRQQMAPPRRPTQAVIAVLVVGAGLAAAVVTGQYRERSQVCRGGAGRMESVWSPDIAARVRAAFARTGHPAAEATAGRLQETVDGFRKRWIEAYTEACEATAIRKQQSAEVLDRQMACLDARRGSAAAMTELYLNADREVVNRAVSAAPRSADIEICRDRATMLAAYPPPSAQQAPSVAEVGQQLDHVDALGKAGRYRQALDAAKTAAGKARQLGYPPLVARALYALADIQSQTDAPASEPLFGEAEQAAARARDDRLLTLVLAKHIAMLAAKLGRTEAALALRPAAEAAAIRAPGDRLVEAAVAHSLGSTFYPMGDYPHALEQTERDLALRRAARGDDDPEVGNALYNVGVVLTSLNRYAEARHSLESALATRKRVLGTEDHLDVARTLKALGDVYSYESRYAEALPYYQRALRIDDQVLGPGSADAGSLQANVAANFFDQCQFAEAARWSEEALQALDQHWGRQNVITLFVLTNLGTEYLELGAYERAEQSFREALARKSAGAGTEGMHPVLVNALIGLANIALARGRPATALPDARSAVTFAEQRISQGHIHRAEALGVLGRTLLALGRASEARPLLERALTGEEHSQVPVGPALRATTQFALADALWRTGGDRKRAQELAHLAQHTVTTCPQPKLAGQIERWLQRTATR